MSVKSDNPLRPGSWIWQEDDLLLGAVQGAPPSYSALQGTADAGTQFGVTAQQLVEDGHGANARCGAQHRHDLGVEDPAQGIRATPSTRDFRCEEEAGAIAPQASEIRGGVWLTRIPLPLM